MVAEQELALAPQEGLEKKEVMMFVEDCNGRFIRTTALVTTPSPQPVVRSVLQEWWIGLKISNLFS